jgi:hypothetical protein
MLEFRVARHVAFVMFVSAVALSLATAPAHAATVTGGLSIYSNPFDPNNDGVVSGTEATMTVGAIGTGSVSVAGGYSQDDVVNRHDSYQSGLVRLTDGTGVATSGFVQYQAATSFNAGTVIAYQNAASYWASPTPYTLKLGSPTVQATVQTGPGTLGTAPIQVTRLSSVVNVNTLRAEIGMTKYPPDGPTGPTYGEMNEVLVLPTRLVRVAPISVTQTNNTSTPWFNPPSAVSDLDGYGWGAFGNPSLKLDLGVATLVDTVVVANWDTASTGGPVNFNIKDDTGSVIGNVQLLGGAYGEFIPIHFDTYVYTSSLTFDFTDVTNGRTAMREIIVLAVPEPTSVGLLALGGLMLLKRRRTGF